MAYYMHKSGRTATEDEATELVNGKRILRDGFGPTMIGVFLRDAKPADEPKTADDFILAAFYVRSYAKNPDDLKAWLEKTPQRDIEKIASEAAIQWVSTQAGKGISVIADAKTIRDRALRDRYLPKPANSDAEQAALTVDAGTFRDQVRRDRYASSN